MSITVTTVSGVQYSGSWTLQQQMQAKQAGTWQYPPVPAGLYSWGANVDGRLGQNNTIYRSSPVQVGALTTWSNIACGNYGAIATKTDGTLWSWGSNFQGELGQNDRQYRSSPTQVGAVTTWLSLAASKYSSFLATRTNGTLWAWGWNLYGQLGQNDTSNKSSPVQVGALTTWSAVACGNRHTVAIKTDGTLWSWGANNRGQLGQDVSTVYNRSSPIQVGALTTWSTVACGSYYTFATKTDGTLWSWGHNNVGQLGQNNTINRSSPVQVGALTTWSAVACGDNHTIAIKTDGTLWSWGVNNYGELGQNIAYTIYRSSPVQVGALTTWSKISGGNNQTIAIKTDGTLWSWGGNPYGQLGQGDTVSRSSPVQVGAGTTWSKISAGSEFCAAINA